MKWGKDTFSESNENMLIWKASNHRVIQTRNNDT